jgi:RNA polymerase sigma-70 factor (ECF subfamily)
MAETSAFHELVTKIRAGDDDAAAELVRLYEPYIRLVVRGRLHPSLRAQLDSIDIWQSIAAEFFARVASGNFDLDTPEHVRRLLATMALNKLRNKIRGAGPGRVSLAQGQETIDPHPTPVEEAADRELVRLVYGLLSEEERQLLELRLEKNSWATIAKRLGGTEAGRRMQYNRARARVTAALGLKKWPLPAEGPDASE